MAKMIGPYSAIKLHRDNPVGRGNTPTDTTFAVLHANLPKIRGSTDCVYAKEMFKFYLGTHINSKQENLKVS